MYTLIFICIKSGVLAEYKISDEQRQQFKDMLRQSCKKQGAEDKVDAVEVSLCIICNTYTKSKTSIFLKNYCNFC